MPHHTDTTRQPKAKANSLGVDAVAMGFASLVALSGLFAIMAAQHFL